jgi:DNA-binding beta-propeller fold protein YncE
VRSNAIKEKSLLNCHIQYRISVLFLISITLVSSSSYLLPLVYSQELSSISSWSQFGREETSLSWPAGIAVDSSSGNVYVADTANNRIQVFSSNGTYISEWGRYGRADGNLRYPAGIAVDSSSGNVYVADTANNRIQVFSSNGTFSNGTYISQWGGYGTRNGTFSHPAGIAVDSSSGNVYVADTANNRIQVFSSNGTYISKLGTYGYFEENLRSPEGIAVDSSSGNVYVADTANNRIQVFSNSTIWQ